MHHPAPALIRPLQFVISNCVFYQYLSQIDHTILVILGSSVDRVSPLKTEGLGSIPNEGNFLVYLLLILLQSSVYVNCKQTGAYMYSNIFNSFKISYCKYYANTFYGSTLPIPERPLRGGPL